MSASHRLALVQRKQRRFAGLMPIATTTLSASASAPFKQVDVAVGDRVERAGIKGDSGHWGSGGLRGRGARDRALHSPAAPSPASAPTPVENGAISRKSGIL